MRLPRHERVLDMVSLPFAETHAAGHKRDYGALEQAVDASRVAAQGV